MRHLDLETWDRREHFHFFQALRNPCVGLTVPLDARRLAEHRRSLATPGRLSDRLSYCAMRAANQVPELRQRIVNLRPVEFARVDAGFTYIPRGRTLHANCVAAYDPDFAVFSAGIQAARDLSDRAPTLTPAGAEGQGLVYLSVLPGHSFSGMSNPWGDPWTDTVPRVAFGRLDPDTGRLPVSVEALHSFVDGRHLSAFLDALSALFADPEGTFGG